MDDDVDDIDNEVEDVIDEDVVFEELDDDADEEVVEEEAEAEPDVIETNADNRRILQVVPRDDRHSYN